MILQYIKEHRNDRNIFYASADHILKRIGEDDTRPLIKQMLNPFDQIKKLLAQRQKAYEQCSFAVNTEDKTPEQVAEEILKKLPQTVFS